MNVPKRVVITAGGAGIGRALALAFHATCARVAVCDIDADAIAELAKIQPEIMGRVANVTNADDMAAFLGDVDAAFGGVDVALANAGTGGPAGPIESLDLNDWRACISANLDGAFLLCQWAAAHMKAQKSGSIILTSSHGGHVRLSDAQPLCDGKMGCDWPDENACMRAWPLRCARKRHLPRCR